LNPFMEYRWADMPRLAGLALLYALLADLVLGYFSANGNITLVWPPSGLALAALLLGGKKYWPGVYLGALAANLMAGSPLWVSALIALGNTLEPLFGLWLLTRNGRFDPALRTSRDYFRLFFLGGCVSVGVGALNGTATLLLSGFLTPSAFPVNLLHWWMGDGLGVMLFAPLFLVWRRAPAGWFARARVGEAAALFALAFLFGQIIFLDWFHQYFELISRGYWMFVFVAWAAVHFGRHGALLILCMTLLQALIGAIHEVGFFENDLAQTQLVNLWFYITALTVVGMALATAGNERELAENQLRESEARARTLLGSIQDAVFVHGMETDGKPGRFIEVNDMACQQLGYSREALLTMSPLDIDAPDFGVDPAPIAEQLSLGKKVRFEQVHLGRDGRHIPVEISANMLSLQGRPVVISVARDIGERKAAEHAILRDREQQATLRGLLEAILQGGSLEETLGRCLDQLLAVSWLSITPKGGVFLMDEDGRSLRLVVSRNLAPGVLAQCAHLPLGRCHCGQAAATGRMQYAKCVDARHEVTYPGMADHGHYCLPLLLNNAVIGVMALYLPPNFQRDPVKEEFIASVADILAGFISRKLDEKAARASEDLTRSVMHSLTSAIAVLDARGGIMRVNQAWRDFAVSNGGGDALREGVGLNYLDAIRAAVALSEPLAREALAGMEAVLAGASPAFTLEYPCHAPDRQRWFILQASPLAGAVKGLVVNHTDITQRKLAELALERHQQQLEEVVAARTADLRVAEEDVRLILESTADGLYGVDTEGRMSFINPAACEMLGYGAEQLIGQPVHSIIHHSHPDGTYYPVETCPMLAASRGGHVVRNDNEVFWRADGQPIPVSYATKPMFRHGELVGAVVSFQDISELKRAELSTRQALAQAQHLARVKSEFLSNMSHEIRTPLNAVLGLAQVGLRDCVERKCQDNYTHILESGQHLLGIINDVLDFSKIEAGKLALEHTAYEPGAVIDRAVHLVAAQALEKGLAFDVDEAPDLPATCLGDALRLSQVLVNLLSNAVKFTSAGRVALSARLDGDSLVYRIADTGIGMTQEQVARLFTPFEQADGSTTRRFGGTGLGLVISRRFTEMMGGEIHVESRPGEGSAFEVRLPVEEASPPRAWAIPSRVILAGLSGDEADRLAAALSAYGATVECPSIRAAFDTPADLVLLAGAALQDVLVLEAAESACDGGQRLALAVRGEGQVPPRLAGQVRRVNWPLRARHVLAAYADVPAEPTSAGVGPRLKGLSILAAEDNEVNRLVLAEMLQGEGAVLTCVEDGRQAVDQLRESGSEAFDILLTDIQMPVMDGYQVARHALELAPDLPVIGLTAHAMMEERARCLAAGMVEHVTKPIDIETLVAAILRHARRRPAAAPGREAAPARGRAAGPREAATAPGEGVIDWARLEANFNGKTSFVNKLVAMVLTTQADSPGKLREAVRRRDMEALAFLAHSLKGMSGNLMAESVRESAARAETAARQGRAEASELAVELAGAMERMLAALAARAEQAEKSPD
jgi:PAS domain S-box-containing protein